MIARKQPKGKMELIAKYADKVGPDREYEEYSKLYQSSRIDILLNLLRDISGRVLDVACFDGYIAKKIRDTGNKDVYGVDISEKAVELAKVRGINAQVVDIDTEDLPYQDQFFDCVVAGEIIEHVYDTDALVKEAKRVLKPGGVLIITTPNLASLTNRFALLAGKYPDGMQPRAEPPGHIRLFTFPILAKLLEDHGFHIEKFEGNIVDFPIISRLTGFSSKRLARFFPRLAKNIIVKATKGEGV